MTTPFHHASLRLLPHLVANRLSLQECTLLYWLRDTRDAPPTMGDIAQALCFSSAGATPMADVLEAKGLARRTHSKTDRRRIRMELTPAGMALLETLDGALEKPRLDLGV